MSKNIYYPSSTLPSKPAHAAGVQKFEKPTYSTKRVSQSDDKFYNIQLEKQLDKELSSPHPPHHHQQPQSFLQKKFGWLFKRRTSVIDSELGNNYDEEQGGDSNFSRQFRSASVPSITFGFSDQESMGDYMEAHILAAIKRTSFNRLTMTFRDSETEKQYARYFLDRSQTTWSWFAVIAMVLSAAVQVLLTKYYPEIIRESITTDMILVWVGGVVPMIVLILVNWVMKKEVLATWVHVMSAMFLLILGPVQICARYFIANKEKYPPSLTSPVYILILVSTVFFFRMRFLATVVSMLIAIGVWLSVFGLSISGHTQGDGLLTSFTTSAFGMVIAGIVICFIAYEQERGFRFQYLSDNRFLRINNKLQRQLKGLQSNYTNRIADLESPLEKAILGMKYLMASPQITAEQYDTLDMIMACLNSPNLLTPDLDNQVTCGKVELDSEQEKWLFNGVAQRKESTVEILEAQQLPQLKISTVGSLNNLDVVDVESFRTPEAKQLLENVAEFNFDIFAFEKATKGNPLLVMADHLIVRSGLLERLGLPVDKFLRFISTLEAGYHKDLAFHNSLHASDVLHCINYLVTRPNLYKLFSDIELIGIYMAAAMHDYDHPGVNNQFLIATNDPRALLYNDKSVLENHHCANSFQVLTRPECNFLAGIDRATYKKLREQIVEMILATDLAQHFSLVALFKKKVMTASTFDPENTREDRTLLLQMMIKCADVSNPTKSFPLYEEWIHRIIAEWYVQGDKERELGLPISAFCNRDAPPAPSGVHPHQSSQKGFIEFIVAPMFDAFAMWTDIEVIQSGLETNRARWSGKGDEKKVVAAPQPAVRKESVSGAR